MGEGRGGLYLQKLLCAIQYCLYLLLFSAFLRACTNDTMETRTKHTYKTQIYRFVKNILVVCPGCEGKALVQTGNFQDLKFEINGVRMVCGGCGYNKTLGSVPMRSKHLIFGAPLDPFFHQPVWLQSTFSGQLLWAYNLEHLEFLAEHVGAKLRERNGFQLNVKSIGARLPRWMTSKNNRDAVLKAIMLLKKKTE